MDDDKVHVGPWPAPHGQPLPPSGGDGTLDAMPDSSATVDAKIAAAEARGETRLARLEGKMDVMIASFGGIRAEIEKSTLSVKESRNFVLGSILAAALAIMALIVGMATYGDALFGRGINVRDVVQAVIAEQAKSADTPSPKADRLPLAPSPK